MKRINMSWVIGIIVAFFVYKILSKGFVWAIIAFIASYAIGYNIIGHLEAYTDDSSNDDLLNDQIK